MHFNMNAVWSRGIELVQDNFQLLLVIAAVFLLLPTVAIYLLVPDIAMLMDPTIQPDAMEAIVASMVGQLALAGLFALTFQFAGYGAMVALMGDARPTVGQALGAGMKAVPSLFVVMITFAVVYVLGAMLIMVPISLLVGVAGAPALGIIGVVPVLLFVIWLMARLSMTMPALVLGASLNPFSAMGKSFRITKPKQWPILGFWAVLFAIFMVISLLFNGVVGLVAALLGSGTAAMLILGLANGFTSLIAGMIVCGIAVAMYGQLSGPSTAAIEDTFE